MSASLYVEITEKVDFILVSAADMLWEVFSVIVVSGSGDNIPIRGYDVRESNICILFQ